jgi:hypothetical protein
MAHRALIALDRRPASDATAGPVEDEGAEVTS